MARAAARLRARLRNQGPAAIRGSRRRLVAAKRSEDSGTQHGIAAKQTKARVFTLKPVLHRRRQTPENAVIIERNSLCTLRCGAGASAPAATCRFTGCSAAEASRSLTSPPGSREAETSARNLVIDRSVHRDTANPCGKDSRIRSRSMACESEEHRGKVNGRGHGGRLKENREAGRTKGTTPGTRASSKSRTLVHFLPAALADQEKQRRPRQCPRMWIFSPLSQGRQGRRPAPARIRGCDRCRAMSDRSHDPP